MAVLYWIHLKEHTNPYKEGYIGVTIDIKTRIYRHKVNKKISHLYNAIKKYGWNKLIIDVLYTGSINNCYTKEKKLRSKIKIGWNASIGGFGGDRSMFIDYKNRINQGWNYDKTGVKNPFYGKHHSTQTIDKIRKKKCTAIIKTPEGIFYGYRDAARYYNINKITAKKWASKKQGWSYENV